MSLSSSPLTESFPTPRFDSPAPSPTRTEVDIPDVDQSFNSSMTLSSTASPMPLSPLTYVAKLQASPLLDDTLGSGARGAGFLSPSPSVKPRRPDPVPLQRGSLSRCSLGSVSEADEAAAAPMLFAVPPPRPPRAFGREVSLNARPVLAGGRQAQPLGKAKSVGLGMMLPPAVPDVRAVASRNRGGIPMQWTSSNEEMQSPRARAPLMMRRDSEPSPVHPSPRSVPMRGANFMDVDSPRTSTSRVLFQQSPSTFSGASSFSGSPGLGSFFCDSPSQPAPGVPSKRRSLVTSSPASPSSSPSAKRASLGQSRAMEKANTSGALLFGPGARASTLAARRTGAASKRPTLLPVNASVGRAAGGTTSAFPILYGPPTAAPGGMFSQQPLPRGPGTAPMRRAFSVCDQTAHEMSEDEQASEYEASPSMLAAGAHAAYARRHASRVVARPDGSPGFKPLRASMTAAPAAAEASGSGNACASPTTRGGGPKASPYGPGGLPGFGDNEVDGKILPCHKVKEDGLVRITPETLDDVLAGKYDGRMRRFHVLDCRFDYEYAGGHIDGAINVKSMDALDALLLSEADGVHKDGERLPTPSRSGQANGHEQVVLIFHCEFSAKRAPTFAKHLRSRDRLLNGAIYPKICYPELYILEGGYSSFFKACANRCEPQAYVPMDDPRHFHRRDSDLHDFRKFARTRSFTYGETQQAAAAASQLCAQPPRLAPPCPPLAFAAASAAQGRRQVEGGITIDEEDGEDGSSPLMMRGRGGAGGAAADGSPGAPRVQSMNAAPIFGSAKTRTLGRVGFSRVASYAGPQRQ